MKTEQNRDIDKAAKKQQKSLDFGRLNTPYTSAFSNTLYQPISVSGLHPKTSEHISVFCLVWTVVTGDLVMVLVNC